MRQPGGSSWKLLMHTLASITVRMQTCLILSAAPGKRFGFVYIGQHQNMHAWTTKRAIYASQNLDSLSTSELALRAFGSSRMPEAVQE